MPKYERNVSMLCPVCGNDMFSSEDENLNESEIIYKCSDCGKEYTRDELIDENQMRIDSAIEDFEDDILKDLNKIIKGFF